MCCGCGRLWASCTESSARVHLRDPLLSSPPAIRCSHSPLSMCLLALLSLPPVQELDKFEKLATLPGVQVALAEKYSRWDAGGRVACLVGCAGGGCTWVPDQRGWEGVLCGGNSAGATALSPRDSTGGSCLA